MKVYSRQPTSRSASPSSHDDSQRPNQERQTMKLSATALVPLFTLLLANAAQGQVERALIQVRGLT